MDKREIEKIINEEKDIEKLRSFLLVLIKKQADISSESCTLWSEDAEVSHAYEMVEAWDIFTR